MPRRILFLLLLVACVVFATRIAERHTVQLDLTERGTHSLSEVAREALDQLGGNLEITAFVPQYPVQRAELEQLLAPYLAHDAQPRLVYVDPLKHPDQAAALGATTSGELHLRWSDRREIVERPGPEALDQALNRLALRGERWVVSLTGHGERAIDDTLSGLSAFAGQAERLGYRMIGLDARRIDRLPDNTAVLILAGPREPYPARVAELIETFVTEGGRVLWMSGLADGTGGTDLASRLLGIRPLPGVVVDADAARFGLESPANAIAQPAASAVLTRPPEQPVALYRAMAFEVSLPETWSEIARFRSSERSWNETGELTGRLRLDPERGERMGPLDVGIALQSTAGTASGRVVYLGSAYPLSNAALGQLGNGELAVGLLRWLSDNPQLRPEDLPSHTLRWTPQLGAALAFLFMAVLPVGYLAGGVWLRTRRRRR
jgi:hypothetical protein